ncbi:hypothetical protein [Edwardsiella tarda]|uniref:hypothetical protein n=1 Tax=Edwardsiella tarda TaxID=636 RepID=UPI0005521A1D|nr:hypothetical protein [Edwardsiella tarda]
MGVTILYAATCAILGCLFGLAGIILFCYGAPAMRIRRGGVLFLLLAVSGGVQVYTAWDVIHQPTGVNCVLAMNG